MSSIQDIHAFAERIYDIVQDYVDGNYNADDVLAIGKRCGKITMKADAKEAIKKDYGTRTDDAQGVDNGHVANHQHRIGVPDTRLGTADHDGLGMEDTADKKEGQ